MKLSDNLLKLKNFSLYTSLVIEGVLEIFTSITIMMVINSLFYNNGENIYLYSLYFY